MKVREVIKLIERYGWRHPEELAEQGGPMPEPQVRIDCAEVRVPTSVKRKAS